MIQNSGQVTFKGKEVLLRTNVSRKIENFFKKKVYSGGFIWKDTEKLFSYNEASQRCYKVRVLLLCDYQVPMLLDESEWFSDKSV